MITELVVMAALRRAHQGPREAHRQWRRQRRRLRRRQRRRVGQRWSRRPAHQPGDRPLRSHGALCHDRLLLCGGLWKFNTSFFDPIATCAPVFLMQLVAAYLPGELVPPGALTDVLTWTAPHVAATVEVLIPLLLSQASRPLLRQLGLALGLTFHFLIALTPPPNNAGGFSVGATVRYFFFMPAATSAACHLLTPSLYLPTMATTTTTLRSWLGSGSSAIALRGLAASLYDLKSLALIGAVVAAVITAASQGSVTLQGSLPVFMVVGIVYVRAFVLTIGSRWSRATKTPASFPRAPSKSHSRGHLGIANALFLALAFAYAYALPILGLQDIAACGMFANMHFVTAAYTGSNHWLVPTGLLQARYEHASARDNPFAGGVVQIVHTTSSSMRDLFPAESTSMLSPRAREYLSHAGHAAREFGPSTTRVVGTLPGMKPHPDPARPQLEYLLPAVELRRLLAEARANNESFTLTYKRVSRTGAPFAGRVVDVVDIPVSSTAGSGKEESGGSWHAPYALHGARHAARLQQRVRRRRTGAVASVGLG